MNRVKDPIAEAKAILSAFEGIAKVQEAAVLSWFGVDINDLTDSYDSSSESQLDDDVNTNPLPPSTSTATLSRGDVVCVFRRAQCNRFEVVSMGTDMGIDPNVLEGQYEYKTRDLAERELRLLEQSYSAYLQVEARETPSQMREASAINGDILSESESDDLDGYLTTERARAALTKKVKAAHCKCQRDRAKAIIAQKHFLKQKLSKRVSHILSKCPLIGKTVEEFVQDRSVGADT